MIILAPFPLLLVILAYLVIYWVMAPVRRIVLGWRERRRAQLEWERETYKDPIEVWEASRRSSTQGSLRSEG